MALKLEFNDTKNFTGRSRIKQKDELFSLHLIERNDEVVRIQVNFNRRAIEKECKLDPAIEKDFILDSFVLGEIHRHLLPEYRNQDEITFHSVPEGANIEFRLKVVGRTEDTNGKILAATSGRVRLRESTGEDEAGEKKQGIFHPILSSELGGQIWHVKWNGEGDFQILVNADYFHKFHDDPVFEAHIYPEIVRNVATGILLRHDSVEDLEEDSLIAQWVQFIEQSLKIPLTGEDTAHFDDSDDVSKLDFVDRIVEEFSNKRWREGKTLLEGVL